MDYIIRANEQEMRTVFDLAVKLREYSPILPVQSVHYADVLDAWMARYDGPGLWDSEADECPSCGTESPGSRVHPACDQREQAITNKRMNQ